MSGYLHFLRTMGLCVLCLSLSGCATSQSATEPVAEEQPASIATLGYVPDCSYEYREQVPHIITDRVGYLPTGKKVAYIKGDDLNKDYRIVTSLGSETVYEGKLKKVSADDAAEGLYIGDFSDFNRHGSFRIYQQDVGYSYIFNIDEVSLNSIYNEAYHTIVSAEYSDTESLIYTLGNLMVTAQIYPNTYTNTGFIKGGVELLMTQQHTGSGAVYGELKDQATLDLIAREASLPPAEATVDTESMLSVSATEAYAGLLAQYYSQYAADDPETASEALRAAVKAYSYIEKSMAQTEDVSSAFLYAACELYKATGQLKYRNAIALYDERTAVSAQHDRTDRYDYTFLSDVAYLSTSYKTDYARCESLMTGYSDIAGHISSSSDRAHFYVQADIKEIDGDKILDNMMALGLVGYVLSGREYSGIEANYLHYLFGLNEDMVNYYSESPKEGFVSLNSDAVRLSKLIFALGGEAGL